MAASLEDRLINKWLQTTATEQRNSQRLSVESATYRQVSQYTSVPNFALSVSALDMTKVKSTKYL